jgi:hypothetical protein
LRIRLEIGTPLRVEVTWYDKCVVPPADKKYEGEVIGWRKSQVIVSVRDYAVLRFWKSTGLEVGNRDHARRGFSVDMKALTDSTRPSPGIPVTLD